MASPIRSSTRESIHVENARILDIKTYSAGQYHVRFHSPLIANSAQPGSFVHLQCNPLLPMRRPMSIMRTEPARGSLEILYKIHGYGTSLLSNRGIDAAISLIGPIGVPFKLSAYRRFPLLIGGGVGIPPIVFLTSHIRTSTPDVRPLVLMGSEVPFPFAPRPSQIVVPNVPVQVLAAMPLLEDWGVPSRLASQQDFAGCFQGYVTDLARCWLDGLASEVRSNDVEVFACGPTPMLKAVQTLAIEYDLPCQLSLEEYMACAVGGCAGCAVSIRTPTGPAMKRVCVDGPVFDAHVVNFS